MDEDDYEMFKIVVIGSTNTGKTNIAARFVKGQFFSDSKATVGVEFLAKVLTIRNTKVKITFWDTAGQERYKSLSKVYYKGAAGIIIVYDVCEPQSYLDVEGWLRLANENLNINEVKIILIGNKIDKEDQRKIQFDRVKAQYKDKFDIDCFETSAKTGAGIQQSIMFLIEKIYDINSKNRGSQMPFDDSFEEEEQQEPNNYIDSIVQEKKKAFEKQPEPGFKKQPQQPQQEPKVNKGKPQESKKPVVAQQPKKQEKPSNKQAIKDNKKGAKLTDKKEKEKKSSKCC